ncbi:MAG: 4Fe-4S binding protein [Atribacterota bacterium]|nr:4Fe-4S binding protein [Atribacterota bacterium]
MKINEDCIGCGFCEPYCPMNAIKKLRNEKKYFINLDECVECGICKEFANCPKDAIENTDLDHIRSIRKEFSDPKAPHVSSTGTYGRGTAEMKTNEVTGLIKKGYTALSLEIGRPGMGAKFSDIEKITKKLAKKRVTFAPESPLTYLIKNQETGEIKKDYLNEKVLSAIVEFVIKTDILAEVLKAIKEVSSEIDTVFSLCIAEKEQGNKDLSILKIAEKQGFKVSINGKTNMGLGRPLYKEAQ